MTATTDEFLDLTRRGQEAVATAVRSWADAVQSVSGSFAGSPEKLPDLHAFVGGSVEHAFDMAEMVLAAQRQIARTVLAASAQATEVLTEQALRTGQSVTAHTANAAESVADATVTTAGTDATGAPEAPRARRAKD